MSPMALASLLIVIVIIRIFELDINIMHTYSLDFLQKEWEGAGFDIAVGAVFEETKLNSESIKNFLIKITTMPEFNIKYLLQNDPSKWHYVLKDEIDEFLKNQLDWNSISFMFIDILSNEGFRGYIELAKPDQLVVGGPSEAYYSGNIKKDYAIANELVDIIVSGARHFGNGFWHFGAGCDAIDGVEELRKKRIQPNLRIGVNSEIVNDIISKCKESRELPYE